MKKAIRVLVFMLAILSIFVVAACSRQQNTPENQPQPIDYKEALYQLKDTYTGDNAKVHTIVNTLSNAEFSLKSLEFTLKLETDREPYGIKVFYLADSRTNYRFQEDIETAWHKNAAVIFSLIPNAGEISFHIQDEHGVFGVSYYNRENLSKRPGLEYFTDDNVKKAADNIESFSAYLLRVAEIKNVAEFYSAEQKLFNERGRQVYGIIGADYDFHINEGADFSVLITNEFIDTAPIKILTDHKERLLGAVGSEVDFIIYGTRNYKTGDWFGPPYLFLFDGERLVTYVNLETYDGQREVQESLSAIEKMGILKTKLIVRYWLGEGGDKTIEYFVRGHTNGQKDLLDGQDKVILSGFENYDPQYDFIHMTYYEEVEPFIKVEKDRKFGYITWEGKPLVDTVWDTAFMDVLNDSGDTIFVKQGDKWGGIKVIDGVAQPVDWNRQPSAEAKISFNHWFYDYQWTFYQDQIRDGQTDISQDTLLFFYDYFSKNNMELRLLPEFSANGIADEELFSHFMIANSDEGEWADGSLTEADFDRYMKKYFGDLSYTHKTYGLLEHKEGKYDVQFGFSYHGSVLYEITSLEKRRSADGKDIWKAKINGYYFHEGDGSEEDQYQSDNAKAVWQELKKPDNKYYTFYQMRDRMLLQNPSKKLKVTGEWTIEFIVNDPLGDIYFTYLACDSTWTGV